MNIIYFYDSWMKLIYGIYSIYGIYGYIVIVFW